MPDLVPVEPEILRPTILRKPPFPSQVDNTMRGDFVMCPTKWAYGFMFQLAPLIPSVHLHAGGAIARSLEVARQRFYGDGATEAEAKKDGLEALMNFYGNFIAPPTKSGDKSLENCIRAYDSYMQRYRLGRDLIVPFKTADGKLMIEFTFSIPTEVKNPTTGDPILYSGRCDMIGVMNDQLFVVDEKTTVALGDSWADQWKLESQFTGYMAAARLYGYQVAGAVIRGIGLLKTKISHADLTLYRSPWEIDRWWNQLHKDLRRMVQQYEAFDFDMALSKNACGAYGGCAFRILCESQDPERWMNQYRIRVWDPLKKDFGENLLLSAPLARNTEDDLVIDLKELM